MRNQIVGIACGVLLTLSVVSANLPVFNISALVPQCSSEIYCYGDLLRTVQMAKLYVDSKTFVDMKLKASPATTLANFRTWQSLNVSPSNDDIQKFVDANFEAAGSEFVTYVPEDYVESPQVLDLISDPNYRQFAKDLNDLWLLLGRKMIDDVAINPDLYSIVYVKNPVIVPGGRFREFYYWDSYWIIRGLLITEMYTTAKGMLENFVSVIERFGFVPNGGRIYYSGRSQPPLLIPMVKEYLDATGDVQFIVDNIDALETEFQYWMDNHVYEVKGHKLAVFGDKTSGPRPESYSEDVASAASFTTDDAKEEHYAEVKACAESGMDFSTRWFVAANGSNVGTLADVKCRWIVPVDLNAELYWNAKLLAEFFALSNNAEKAAQYKQKAYEIYVAVQAVLWHEDVGAWLDYDLINNQRRNYYVATNLAPLWTNCFNKAKSASIAKKVLAYIRKNELDGYEGGVPNTLVNSGQQWDAPNVWPPMQYLLVTALRNLNSKEADKLAYSWASRWVLSNYIGYTDTQVMFEKYSSDTLGGYGGGGEYTVQAGFGWTNGVILDFLKTYGGQLSYNSTEAEGWRRPHHAHKHASKPFFHNHH